MTCISHHHRFAFVHIYKAGGTSVTDMLLPPARLRERVACNSVGRKLFYAVNLLQEAASRGQVAKGTSSWYMGLYKHAPLSEWACRRKPGRCPPKTGAAPAAKSRICQRIPSADLRTIFHLITTFMMPSSRPWAH